MLAFFGIGVPELIIICLIGVIFIGAPLAIVIFIVFLIRNQNSGRVAELEAENRELRARLEKGEQT